MFDNLNQQNWPMVNATFNLTENCNLTCSYCFAGGGKSKKRMTFETAKKGINFLIKNCTEASIEELYNKQRLITIGFWGGEPLLEWNLLKNIIEYTKDSLPKDMTAQFSGTTNGVLLTKEKADYLGENNCFFMISLDGTAETHNRYRLMSNGHGSQEIIMKNMEYVLEKWPFYKTRISLYPDRVDHFYEDIQYLFEHKFYHIMFSPVYELNWTEKHWDTFIEQSRKVIDLMVEYRNKGIDVQMEHFKSYCRPDNSKWPCGAGRFYFGFGYDGSIWPCHRFNKFEDKRPWQEKEMCIGHVDYGITRPEVRQKFIDFKPPECGICEYYKTTPCHGGCYGVNFDMNGDISKPYKGICTYVEKQKMISKYYEEKLGVSERNKVNKGQCICNNMCYLEGTNEQIINADDSGIQCHCYNTNYSGDLNTKEVARPLNIVKINPMEVVKKVELLEVRILSIEEKMDKILNKMEKIDI